MADKPVRDSTITAPQKPKREGLASLVNERRNRKRQAAKRSGGKQQ